MPLLSPTNSQNFVETLRDALETYIETTIIRKVVTGSEIVLIDDKALKQTNDNSSAQPSMIMDVILSEFDGTTVLCRVCGDKASGFHYGVHSCEGCKGFFRRSIQQKIQYRPCSKNQNCSIQRVNRNRCQYCRLRKCISVGMSKDAVRFGRVPKREKARIMAAMQSVSARTQEKAILMDLEDESRVTSAIIRAHMDTCEFTREKVILMMQQARNQPIYTHCPQQSLTCPLNPSPAPVNGQHQGQQQLLQDFNERFSPAIRGVVEFAKGLPGFHLLPQEDQVTLLKAGVFEVLLVRLASMFDSRSNTMLCLNGQLLRRESLQSSTNARFLMDSMFDFAERLNNLHLNDAELALFCAIVVLAHDRPGLRNGELIQRVQHRLLSYLQNVIAQNHPENPNLHLDLMNKIPDLRTLNTLHSEKLFTFKMAEQTSAMNGTWEDSSRSSWEDKEGSLGSPSSSCAADEAMRSPVSCSESAYNSEFGSSADSVCGSEISGYTDIRPPFAIHRRRRDHSEGASSGDEASESPVMRKRKSDSPDDSGIESGTERSDKLSSTSVCSSPSWSLIGNNVDEKCPNTWTEKCEQDPEDDMPVLRRALQAPPMLNTDQRIEEAYKSESYKSHKKFRAFPRDEEPHSSQTPVSTATSILAQRLSQPVLMPSRPSSSSPKPKALTAPRLARTLQESPKNHEDALRRADMIGAIIVSGQKCPGATEFLRMHSNSTNNSCRASPAPAPYFIPQPVLERLQAPPTPISSSSWPTSSRNLLPSPMQPSVVTQPRVHLLTTPTPSRYYEPRATIATPVGLGAQPSSSSPSVSCQQGSGMGAQPSRGHCSPMMELQVDIADSQPLNLSTKTPPPTPHEFALEA